MQLPIRACALCDHLDHPYLPCDAPACGCPALTPSRGWTTSRWLLLFGLALGAGLGLLHSC